MGDELRAYIDGAKADGERLTQLTAQLAKANERITTLTAERDTLRAALAKALEHSWSPSYEGIRTIDRKVALLGLKRCQYDREQAAAALCDGDKEGGDES